MPLDQRGNVGRAALDQQGPIVGDALVSPIEEAILVQAKPQESLSPAIRPSVSYR